MDKIYDSLIIGSGPAGLSAAIYLARFNRNVLIVDKNTGRSSYHQINDNYLGFPEGIHSRKLRSLGQKQAKRFGVKIAIDEIVKVRKLQNYFTAASKTSSYKARTLILATGVVDIFPLFPNIKSYIGKSLFWCITCDGYRTRNKRVIVVGHTDDAVTTCLQFLQFTSELSFVLNCSIRQAKISDVMKKRLAEHHIPYFEDVIATVKGKNGFISEIKLRSGEKLPTDFLFSEQGASPNAVLAKELHILTDNKGYIFVDPEQRTNIPLVYAAGDVTKPFSHQVVTAAHEGSQAAQSANYDLYSPFQKE